MQWGQIKTLLILSFLVLDVYLLVQFTEKQEQADLSVLEHSESTIEDQLKTENITVPELSNEEYNETFISVEPKLMKNEELKNLKELDNQTNEVLENKLIISKIKKPISVSKDSSKEKKKELLTDLILFSEEYSFWEWDEDTNILIYFQNKLERPIYYNQNALLLIFLNNNDEITYYTQTALGEYEENKDKRKLIPSMRAIEKLYESDKFKSNDEISSVEIGFHTRVPLDSGVQVFAPTWNVEVNKKSHYFVNAIEEYIFLSEHQLFLKEALKNVQQKMNSTEEKKLDKDDFQIKIKEKIEIIERSEKNDTTI